MWRAAAVCQGADGISASARPPQASCCSQQSIETRKNVIFRKGIDHFSHISICVRSRCGLLPHLSSLFLQRREKLRTSRGWGGSVARGSLVEVEGLRRPRVKNQKTGCCLLTPRARQPTSVDRWVYKPFRGQVGLLGRHGHRHTPTCPSPPQGTSSISLSPPSLPPSFSFSSSSSLSHLPFCPPLFSALFLCPCLSLSLSLPFSLSLSFFPLFPPRFSLSPLFWFYLLSSSFTVKDNTPISTHLRPPPTHPLDFTSVLLVIPAGGNNPVTLRQSKWFCRFFIHKSSNLGGSFPRCYSCSSRLPYYWGAAWGSPGPEVRPWGGLTGPSPSYFSQLPCLWAATLSWLTQMGFRGGGRRRSWGWGEPPWSAPHCLPRCSLEQRRANYRERLWAAGRPRLATFTALLLSKLTRLFQKCLEGLKRSLGGPRTQRAQMSCPRPPCPWRGQPA